MIITKTPYRISFFGGGSDYPSWYERYGGLVINCTINKHVYISIRELNKFFKHNYRISYSKIEETCNVNDIQHSVVRECLKKYQQNKNSGFEIHYDGDLPSRSGMGSSSAFVVGLINAKMAFNKKKISKYNLAKESILFEQKILNETVGIQDQISCCYGGLNLVKINKNGQFHVKNLLSKKKDLKDLSDKLILIYTGKLRTAKYVADTYVKKLNNEKKQDMNLILEQTKLAHKLLLKKDFDSFGELLNETWMIKKKLSSAVSNSRINNVYNTCISLGAKGGKLLGAGGGGFFLIYANPDVQKKIKKKLNKFTVLPVEFTNLGSEIIFNNEI